MALLIFLTILFSVFSTAILSYISMAVMLGPWVHSIIVIANAMIFSCIRSHSLHSTTRSITFITTGASIGGILATACGFAFPTLYFLDPAQFNNVLQSPLAFISLMAVLSFTAGALGLLLANIFEHKLIVVDKLPFPVGEMSYKLASIQENMAQAYQLIAGFVTGGIYSLGLYLTKAPQQISLFAATRISSIQLPALHIPTTMFPLLISIGFIAGNIIMVPLSIGVISKIFIVNPFHTHFFAHLSYNDFSFAFISGMVVYGALMSLLELPKFFKTVYKKFSTSLAGDATSYMARDIYDYLQWALVLFSIFLFFTWLQFSIIAQVYLVVFTAICTYQLLIIGGELGLAPVARFATFVMMPALFFFNPNDIQLTIIATFVEICGGVAVDILFGRKMAHLANVEPKKVAYFQWLGLLVSALSVGCFFWILITKFGLGTAPLIAQRSQTRALTIKFQNFDVYSMILGALYGAILKDFKVSPIMVLGGILMPLEWVAALILGSGISKLCKNPDTYQLYWSGIFAINSIIMIISALW